MATTRVQDVEPFAGYSPGQERPLGGYALLMGAFAGAAGAFAAWLRSSGRDLPERVPSGDFALMTVATHKATVSSPAAGRSSRATPRLRSSAS
jgi:hypothetical protein